MHAPNANAIKVRMTTALRAPTHSLAWCGTEAGVFKQCGIDVSFPVIETTGPEAVHGLARGEWDFCQTGTLPVVENFLNGGDAVVLFRNALQHDNLCIALRPELKSLAELDGKRVGVLSDATSGQTGINARLTLEKAGATATYVGLGGYGNIYKALIAGDIDAGPLPLHLRFAGERRYGWNIFSLAFGGAIPSVFATTRKLIATNREMVLRVAQGFIRTVHTFKTQPEVYIPLLQRFLQVNERELVAEQVRFYLPLFPQVPRMALSAQGLQSIRNTFSKTFPAAHRIEEADFTDSSIVDELEHSGFIAKLYAETAK
jgi:ABC-type nitrate/sulfonate/bicarbonate transport system substrate-binding protein